jgi:hypothetical protein
MIILIIIYIISIIGAILTIRYDSYFNKDSWILFILFCPVVNSIISIVEMLTLVSNSSKFLNEKLYNLITYKAHKKW